MYSIQRILRGLKNRPQRALYRKLLDRLVRPAGTALTKLGSDSAGWVVPIDLIDKDSICYCGGVGEDISFDLDLIERKGCVVYAFDPTPRAIDHVARVAAANPLFKFTPVGLWSSNTELKFFASRNPQLVNYSAVNLQGTDDYFVAEAKRLTSIMHDLGHERIDFLKIDIEGSEYEVLDSLIEDRVTGIRVLCVEFDQPMPITRVYGQVRKIVDWGYDLVCIDGWNYTFIRRGEA